MRELLSVSIFLAEKGGADLVSIFNSGELKTTEKTGKDDLVTRGDHASHVIMYGGMRKAFDNVHVVSEEGGEDDENRDQVGFDIEYRFGNLENSLS